jgi:hypothetical protein
LITRYVPNSRDVATSGARDAMTTVAKLLARKQQLIEALQDDPGPNERDELERQLAQVNEALNLLDKAGPTEPVDEE